MSVCWFLAKGKEVGAGQAGDLLVDASVDGLNRDKHIDLDLKELANSEIFNNFVANAYLPDIYWAPFKGKFHWAKLSFIVASSWGHEMVSSTELKLTEYIRNSLRNYFNKHTIVAYDGEMPCTGLEETKYSWCKPIKATMQNVVANNNKDQYHIWVGNSEDAKREFHQANINQNGEFKWRPQHWNSDEFHQTKSPLDFFHYLGYKTVVYVGMPSARILAHQQTLQQESGVSVFQLREEVADCMSVPCLDPYLLLAPYTDQGTFFRAQKKPRCFK